MLVAAILLTDGILRQQQAESLDVVVERRGRRRWRSALEWRGLFEDARRLEVSGTIDKLDRKRKRGLQLGCAANFEPTQVDQKPLAVDVPGQPPGDFYVIGPMTIN